MGTIGQYLATRIHNNFQTVFKILVYCKKKACGILYMKQASSTWIRNYNPQESDVISSKSSELEHDFYLK